MQKIVDGVAIDMTDDEIAAFTADQQVMQAAIDAAQYADLRSRAYGSIGAELDLLWHMIDQGLPFDKTSTFYNFIADVKRAYPKPR